MKIDIRNDFNIPIEAVTKQQGFTSVKQTVDYLLTFAIGAHLSRNKDIDAFVKDSLVFDKSGKLPLSDAYEAYKKQSKQPIHKRAFSRLLQEALAQYGMSLKVIYIPDASTARGFTGVSLRAQQSPIMQQVIDMMGSLDDAREYLVMLGLEKHKEMTGG